MMSFGDVSSMHTALTIVALVLILSLTDCRLTGNETGSLTRDGGTIAFLRCQGGDIDHGVAGEASTLLNYRWVLPTGEILTADNKTTPTSKYSMQRGGFMLQIDAADRKDSGIYVCLVFSSDGIIHVVSQRFNGHVWTRETIQYTAKIQYGFLAGFVVLVVMAMVCYNYDQHQDRHDISLERKHSFPNGIELPTIILTEPSGEHNDGFQTEGIASVDGQADDQL